MASGGYAVYSGLYLEELPGLMPKKIIGTVFFTQVWHLPKSLASAFYAGFKVAVLYIGQHSFNLGYERSKADGTSLRFPEGLALSHHDPRLNGTAFPCQSKVCL